MNSFGLQFKPSNTIMHAKAFIIFISIFFLFDKTGFSQNYFQQKVDYDIKAELDTLDNKLSVEAKMFYTNNSPDDLDKIILHLWLNAMRDKSSNFANQQLKMGRYDFYFANDKLLGGYEDIEVFINGNTVEIIPYVDAEKTYSDIAQINLKNPLKTGQKIEVNINYKLDIPYAFDRPGYSDQLYQMTQWYPKPAVYDNKGWNAMPYLSLGEFYSEFGDYNVELTLPISYSVVATGFKNEMASSLNLEERKRTVVFEAQNVHDFAWFASEYYIPYTDVIRIDDSEVKVSMFVKEDNVDWEKFMVFAKRALSFFSEEVGVYPYPEMTIVESPDFGSGMEYPMITILDMSGDEQQVDHLLAHEVGHNWFYGILASNERKHAWIDEGLTSFFDHKYDVKYYDEKKYDSDLGFLFKQTDSNFSLLKNSILHLERTRLSDQIDQDSENFDIINYVAMNYEKSAWFFEYLEAYLGEEIFEKAIKKLFEKWKFKHLSVDNLIGTFEEVSSKPVRQIFESLIFKKTPIDFAVESVNENGENYEVFIKNKFNTKLPIQLSGYDENNNLVTSHWFELTGEEGQTLSFGGNEYSRIAINNEALLFEINHRNNDKTINHIRNANSNLNINLMKVGGSPDAYNVNILPMVQHNSYDGFMLGMVAFSDVFPKENVSFYFSPNYAFSSQDVAGTFAIQKDIYLENKKVKNISIGLEGRRFHFDKNTNLDYDLSYNKAAPYVQLNFKNDFCCFSQLEYKWHHIAKEDVIFSPSTAEVNGYTKFNVHQLTFRNSKKKFLASSDLKIQLQYEKYDQPFESQGEYLKTSFEYNTKLNYNKDSKLFLRFYGAYFPINSQRNSSNYADVFTRGSIALTANGISDYTYDEYYFSRTGQNNSASSQIVIDDLGFKNTFETYSKEGMSNNFAMAVNLKMDMPFSVLRVLRVRPYFDMALSNRKAVTSDPLENVFYYSGGLSLEVGEIVGLYLPLFNDNNLNLQYAGSNLLSKLSFKINMNKFNLWNYASRPGKFLE